MIGPLIAWKSPVPTLGLELSKAPSWASMAERGVQDRHWLLLVAVYLKNVGEGPEKGDTIEGQFGHILRKLRLAGWDTPGALTLKTSFPSLAGYR
jgi:hypothetical protein